MEKARILDYPSEKILTLRERIVEFVKDSVISGRLKPGERVPEQEIADNLGISRTPIREAFRQLESEGFITVAPRKGAIVSPITDKDVSEFYAIKSLLEGYAARTACDKLTQKDIKRLDSLNSQMEKAAERGDVKAFFKLDNQFHETFLRASGNEKLCALIHHLVQQFERFRITAMSLPGRMNDSVMQHQEITQAFINKDSSRVEELVRANAERGRDVLVQEISKEKTKHGAN